MGQQAAKSTITEGQLQKFGRVDYILFEDKRQQNLMKISLQYPSDDKTYKQWMLKANQAKSQPQISKYVMLPLKVQGGCYACTASNQSHTLQVCFEKMDFTLSQLIKNRQKFKNYFKESELWYLMYVLIKVAAHCEEHLECIGNIHPDKVLINQDGKIKLFTLLSSPSEVENLVKIKKSRHFDAYIAPEEVKFINEDSMICINDCNHNKVDLFNIGLVLLSALMLKDFYHIYNRGIFGLKQEKINHYLQEIKEHNQQSTYSQVFLNFVEEFLRVRPDKRKTPKYYEAELSKYQKEIQSFEPFDFFPIAETEQKKRVPDETPKFSGKSDLESPMVLKYRSTTQQKAVEGVYLSLAKNIKSSPPQGSFKKDKNLQGEVSTIHQRRNMKK